MSAQDELEAKQTGSTADGHIQTADLMHEFERLVTEKDWDLGKRNQTVSAPAANTGSGYQSVPGGEQELLNRGNKTYGSNSASIQLKKSGNTK